MESINVAGILQEAGDAESRACTRSQVLIMIGRVVENFLTSQNQTYWKITNTKHGKGKKLQNVHNLLSPVFQIMT